MLREIIDKTPVEIFVHVAEAVSLVRKHEHVETLACLDEGVDYTDGISRMYIIVDVTMNQEKVPLEVLRNLRVRSDLVVECGIALFCDFLLHDVMGLAPPAVIDVVVMVSCT